MRQKQMFNDRYIKIFEKAGMSGKAINLFNLACWN